MNMDIWNSLSKQEQETLSKLIKQKLEIPAWEDADEETVQGINCLTGIGKCDYGKPNNLKLVDIKKGDMQLSKKILVNDVLPAWAKQVTPDIVEKWNDTVGKEVGLKATK